MAALYFLFICKFTVNCSFKRRLLTCYIKSSKRLWRKQIMLGFKPILNIFIWRTYNKKPSPFNVSALLRSCVLIFFTFHFHFLFYFVLLTSHFTSCWMCFTWYHLHSSCVFKMSAPSSLCQSVLVLSASFPAAFFSPQIQKLFFLFLFERKLASQPISPIFDYANVVYQCASETTSLPLNTVYSRLAWFVPGCSFSTHYCTMYNAFSSIKKTSTLAAIYL